MKFSIDRVNNKAVKAQAAANSPSPLLGNLQSITTNGQYAVTFHLKSPQVTWPSVLATQCCFIVPSDTYSRDKLRSNTDSQVGTGPYKLVKYTAGQQAVLQRNDSYWGPKAKTPNLIIRYYSKSSTMKLALQNGEIDMAFQTFTPTELTSLTKAKGLKVHTGPGGLIRYLVFNVKRAPTNNPAVRKAIAYLMPRQAIASRVYHNFVQPLYSMPPAGYPSHTDAFATLYGRGLSPAKAKAVLQKAGLSTPFPIDIWWTPTHYGDASADEYAEIKRGLETGGVFKVTLKSAEWAQYSAALGTQYNAFQLGWFPDYPDAENYVVPFYRSDTFTANGYNNPAMEKLIKAELGCEDRGGADARPARDPGACRQGCLDHPRLAGQDDRRLEHQGERDPGHARPDRDHAVLEADQVLMREARGAVETPPRRSPARPSGRPTGRATVSTTTADRLG